MVREFYNPDDEIHRGIREAIADYARGVKSPTPVSEVELDEWTDETIGGLVLKLIERGSLELVPSEDSAEAATSVLVVDVVCPRCDAGAGIPCAKLGELIRYVTGQAFHQERWGVAMKDLES